MSLNSLRGEVPQAVSNLTNLEVLDLSSNCLTGEIPWALESLHFLSYFNVSNNDLDGPVPAGGQFCMFPSSSFAGNPGMEAAAGAGAGADPTLGTTRERGWHRNRTVGLDAIGRSR
jgi:hypothetical protein